MGMPVPTLRWRRPSAYLPRPALILGIAGCPLAASSQPLGMDPSALPVSTTDTLFVAEREDHSPAMTIDPLTGGPVLAWIASAADTTSGGSFDELVVSAYNRTSWMTQVVEGPGDYYTPSVLYAVDGARWLVWAEHDGTDSRIRVRRDDGCSTLQFTLDDPLQPDLEPAACADDSGGIFVAWQGWRGDNYEILAAAGDASGFGPTMTLSSCTNSDREPAVVWGDGKAWVAWSAWQNIPYNLVLRTWDGVSLSPEVQITDWQRARAFTPDIAWDRDNGLLWVTSLFVNQAWTGFNLNEPMTAIDLGHPTIRAFDGTNLYAPVGVDSLSRVPTLPMDSLGFGRDYPSVGNPLIDRCGSDAKVVTVPGGHVWFFQKQLGVLVESGRYERYWGVVGTGFGGSAWTAPDAFVELRTSLGWEKPAVAVSGDQLWVAWTADDRSQPIWLYGNHDMFGSDLNVVVRSVTVDTTGAGPPSLVPLGPAPSPPACVTVTEPDFTIDVGGQALTLLHGDMHRHSSDISWDGSTGDPLFKHTIAYSQDWLGHDYIMPSDHVQMYSKAVFVWIPKWARIMDTPVYRVFAGYERIMAGGAGGHQNVLYRDPAQFAEATTGLPSHLGWDVVYSALQGVDALSVPHTTAQLVNVTNWDILADGDPLNLPAPLRLVEVYQSARESFEYLGCPHQYTGPVSAADSGWVSVALAMGMRLGLVASSDHTSRAGYMSVYVTDRSRDAIFQGLYDRHCYGSSRATRFNCDFRVGGALMGSEIQSSTGPRIDVLIEGPNPLASIEINKDGNPSWFSASSADSDTTFTYFDPDPVVPGTSSFYYLRVLDANSKLLWTSPVWVDFTAGPGAVDAPSTKPPEPLRVEAHPNPSVGVTRLALSGIAPAGARLKIYDVRGRLLRRIDLAPGGASRIVEWDGRDEDGVSVAPGVYFVVAQSGGTTCARRVVRLR